MTEFEKWKKAHIKECRAGLARIDRLLNETPKGSDEWRILNGMRRDLIFAIAWLELGREPDKKTDVNRLSKRRREVLIDDFNRVHFENDDLTAVWEGEEEDFREYWADYVDQYFEE